jgi:hypothetical protein
MNKSKYLRDWGIWLIGRLDSYSIWEGKEMQGSIWVGSIQEGKDRFQHASKWVGETRCRWGWGRYGSELWSGGRRQDRSLAVVEAPSSSGRGRSVVSGTKCSPAWSDHGPGRGLCSVAGWMLKPYRGREEIRLQEVETEDRGKEDAKDKDTEAEF